VTDSGYLAVSRIYEADQALELFQLTQARIVAKRKDSLYFQGKRTKSWVKIKNLMDDDDFVVCGYIRKENHMVSVVLGQYRGKNLVHKGHVTLEVSGETFAGIQAQSGRTALPFSEPIPAGHGNENAVWLEPGLVCTVEFMHRTQNVGMRQPVFKGLRRDKSPKKCTDTAESNKS